MSRVFLFQFAAILAWPLCVSAQDAVSASTVEFVDQIQPILTKHCVQCHGAKKQEAGLRLDSGRAVLDGSDQGAIVEAKAAAKSRLLIAITGGTDEISKMPPKGPPLDESQIALIKRWIDQGAVIPQDSAASAAKSDHWAFRHPVRVPLPAVVHPEWTVNEIDRFILAQLESRGLFPSPEANRATLIRRLYLDLLGLLPSPEEVEAFIRDSRPDAYFRLVERLLASPGYGERWGRHWLDAARYADSNGYTRDFGRDIWKYREWVIGAINRDLPFDQFTVEQFAGDLLQGSTLEQKIATGFHRNTLINEEGGTDQEQFRVDAVADRVATTGEVYLGLTLLCARCHSHKYDPISQREFYQFFAFLNNCDEPTLEAPSDWQVARGELEQRATIRGKIAELEKEVEKQRPELEQKQRDWEKTITPQQRSRLPGPVQVAYDMAFEKRDAANKKIIEDYFRKSEEGRRDFPALESIAKLREVEPKIPTTLVMMDRKEPRKTHVHRRGDFLDLGDEVVPAVPSALHPLAANSQQPTRLDLARWLVDPANPLTPRVIMNRYWQQFFGHGIVETDNDFGVQGSPPTHPELLDWLAVEFVESGWNVKQMHRLIVSSATYRQSSSHAEWGAMSFAKESTSAPTHPVAPIGASVDPENKLLARQNRVRLDAEIIRDIALTASGLMTFKVGGPSVFPPQPEGVFEFTQDPKPWNVAQGEDRYRRGMYTHFWRSSPYPAMMVFDAPNGNVSCTRRLRSNTPLQALTLANDVQYVECAQALANRILTEGSADISKRGKLAFQLCLAREPSQLEMQRLAALIDQQVAAFNDERAAWTAICRVLLNLDEFITRE
jgi:mono/diheme cytochrome c family protein